MKILRITIQNLNSLRLKRTIDFTTSPLADTGLFAITGDTGAGKTTLLDAMTLALYGRVHRNKDVKEVLSFGATECLAEVEFTTRGERFQAKWSLWRARGKTDGNILGPSRKLARWDDKQKAFVIIAEKIREVDEQVELVTGLDYDRFSRSVLLAQGDFAAFLQADERDRSDLLERMTGTAIYTRISIAAYERYKLEGKKLEDLQQSLQGLALLEQEEVAELQESLQTAQSASDELAKVIEARRKEKQWLQRLTDLADKEASMETALQNLIAQETALQDDFARLQRSHTAQAFRADLDRIADLQEQLERLAADITELKEKLVATQEIVDTTTTKRLEQEKTVTVFQEDWQAKQALFEQISELDVEIRKEAERIAKEEADVQLAEAELIRLQAQQQELATRLAQLSAKQAELDQWMEQHQGFAHLKNDLPSIDFTWEQLQERQRERTTLEQAETKMLQQQAELQTQVDRALQAIEEHQQRTQQLHQQFKQYAPENYTTERSEVLNLLHQDIEQLSEQRKNLQQLFQLNEEYQKLTSELAGYEELLNHLRLDDMKINKGLMSSMDLLDELKKRLDFKQGIYDQQQLIANYEKDREKLSAGDPCPLCFSLHHPFRETQVQTYVDQAKQELNHAKQQYDRCYEQHKALLNRQKEIGLQMMQLTGDEQSTSGQVDHQLSKILEYEDRIARIAPDLAEGEYAMTRSTLLQRKLAVSESLIEEKKDKRNRLTELNRKLEAAEQQAQDYQKTYQARQSEQRVLAEKLTNQRLQLTDLNTKYAAAAEDLSKLFKKYQFTFTYEAAGQLIAKLKSEYRDYVNNEQALSEAKKAIELVQQEAQQIAKQLSTQQQKNNDLQQHYQQISGDLRGLRAQRQNQFGELDPKAEKRKLADSLAAAMEELQQLTAKLAESKSELEGYTKLLREKEKEHQRIEQKLSQLQTELLQRSQTAGFMDLAAVQAALLPEPEQVRLTQLRQDIETQLLKARQSLRDLHTELQTEREKKLTELPEAELEAALATANVAYQSQQQSIGALREKLAANEQKKNQSAELVQQIEQQQQEYRRWSQLNDVIGQADGKKFRTFAQGLTLRRLAYLANKHLEMLNGRYTIFKRSDSDLELDIIDTYQADNRRSMNTLSGGESFLVSLALALGLSDLAGRDTQIHSLFIDEGFGTLDETSLDLAITTLENLQAVGKTIGVISHVKALKERISTQIQIRKKGSGFSEIEVIG